MSLMKEAEMKAIKLAGLVALLVAPMAMATDGNVVWSVRLSTDTNGNTLAPANVPQSTTSLYATISVAVTGDNQGLYSSVMDVSLKDMTAGTIVPWVIPTANVIWKPVYVAPGGPQTGVGINQTAGAGGPGMNANSSVGTFATDKAYLTQLGVFYPSQWSGRHATEDTDPETLEPLGTYTWSGDQVWGVGLSSRKAALLKTGQTIYDVERIRIQLNQAGWVTGHSYQVELRLASAAVLNSGIDLEQVDPIIASISTAVVPTANNANFYWVPEPATLVLLAAAGLLYRRRRA